MRALLLSITVLSLSAPAVPVMASTSRKVQLGELASRAPASWTGVRTRPPRYGYFILPRARGDKRNAELIIFYFGGGGGSASANITRWKSMFEPPRGKSIDQVTKVSRMNVAGNKVTIVDIRGTYLWKRRPIDPDLRAERRPNHRMIGVVFHTPRGPYFMRLFGPERTIAKHRKAFYRWLRAFR